ncbi:flagellar basal body rod protein FlgG [Azospirillum argentinense]|uniref:Flagellar basal-body rod protein FlgG n=2 Tax=Azospirillum TaxID=191 RepID=A0A060DJK1_9PROT|nr:flagellar basal-body rod protein FlgG [Azospirillum argentinense]AIB11168.1 flagellar basal body rod protein FlgG [Azospirillum argentinense]EZQ08118.1 flagellar basal body rod protein FlgG [Azospirillum argentinense]KAA1058462.1 Flagellar basal-body rod protein FlgG [Azospirillum argentinense]MBK3800612.1 flagellar basal-body rod protein FlgG [Azospirillum argentinense]PNQ98484.1 flagellar basal-body rod protein FlgG [Azospirillum argentinense]
MRSLAIGATGMIAQQLNVETISNNIANATTTGFKKQRAEFQDLLYQNFRRIGSTSSDAGTIVPTGVQVGAGVRVAAVARVLEQGNLTVTDNKLDVAINGSGYFQVQLPSGDTAYTRAGNFKLSPEGIIVTADGYPVQPAITIPAEAVDVAINASGEVMVKLDGQVAQQNVGQLQLATFANAAGLEAVGDNLFLQTGASGEAVNGNPGAPGFGRVVQGALETSNVNIVQEITTLISAQRAYEMNSKVIKTTDEMMQQASQLR